jgi:hypothetical protein
LRLLSQSELVAQIRRGVPEASRLADVEIQRLITETANRMGFYRPAWCYSAGKRTWNYTANPGCRETSIFDCYRGVIDRTTEWAVKYFCKRIDCSSW